MELLQSQIQHLSQQQLQSIELLQMSAPELEAYLQDLAQENPVVELEEGSEELEHPKEDELLHRLCWLEDNDRQNRYYQQIGEDELDPLARIGTEGGLEETLFRFLSRQLYPLELDEGTAQTVRYLAACLDTDGYLRVPLHELADNLALPLCEMERCVEILRSLEPAGVGAANLAQCLELQLHRIHETGPALEIVHSHLEALAKHHYRSIADKMSITVEQVQQAQQIIQELEPRPGAPFEQAAGTQYILPDVFVEEEDGAFFVRLRGGDRPPFHVNQYYRGLWKQSQDREVKDYLLDKLRQADSVLRALKQRESTLLRCAQVIADHQQEFFHTGAQGLQPMRMADVAQALQVHESTISRTVRNKYMQCCRGVYPMNYFFSRSATTKDTGAVVGATAARALLQRLVERENKSRPLSDQKLSEKMAELGCPISRRTVAKYREELRIPNASCRK